MSRTMLILLSLKNPLVIRYNLSSEKKKKEVKSSYTKRGVGLKYKQN